MKVLRGWLVFLLLALACAARALGADATATQCARPGIDAATFDITAPCVLLNGQRYAARLTPTPVANGVAWAVDPRVIGAATCAPTVPYCGVVDSALGLTFRDLDLNGTLYTLRLDLLPNPAPSGMPAWAYRGHHVMRPTASIGAACAASSGTQTVSFVHVGDLHANFDLTADKYSRIRAYYAKVKRENPYTLFTNAGDDHEKGSVAELLSQGLAVREATVAMAFDVRTLGNHDFAWGDQHLINFSRDGGGLVLSSNTHGVGSAASSLGSVDFGVLEVGCLRIGFFGLVSPPWNELDEMYEEDYFPSLHTTYNYSEVARQIVAAHRGEVDVMVMVSHLGYIGDKDVAAAVPGIDLVLGGHTHGGPMAQQVNSTLVVQPNFYADGVTRVDVDVDLGTRTVAAIRRTEQPVRELTEVDATVHQTLVEVMARHAPNAQQTIGYLESAQGIPGIVAIAARAGMSQFGADAALLKPDIIHPASYWSAGAVTAQTLIGAYYVERQKPNTPGINALYQVEVTGAELSRMIAQQPTWVYAGPSAPGAATTYKVLLNKGAALNPTVMFPSGVAPRNVTFKSETWEALAGYATARTAACLSLDSNAVPPTCRGSASYSTWNFADAANPLRASSGPGLLSYRDPTHSGWGASGTVFSTTDALGLPALADGHHRVMAFPATTPDQGYLLTHNEAANGAYAASGLISNYSVVMDILWPTASDARWRALLQTSIDNNDDGDWFVKNSASGGIGIESYFGSLAPNRWYRIALVARAADSGGSLQFYVDGAFVGEKTSATRRWALGASALLFADDTYETEKGYLANLLFAPFALVASEVQALGQASSQIGLVNVR